MCAYIHLKNFSELIVVQMSMAFVHFFSHCNLFFKTFCRLLRL